MPRLILFRHAKAERTQPGSTDHERVLTKSGEAQSAAMARRIAGHGPVDLVLCSSALRATGTWEAAASGIGGAPEVRFSRAIYEAASYLPILRQEGGDAGTVLLVGHNPTMHETALSLTVDLTSAEGAILAVRFPKGAAAVLDFDGRWAKIGPGQGHLAAFLLPGRD